MGVDNIKIIKPLADLTERDVWIKIKENRLSFSKIYNKGYRIIDCKCCVSRHGRRKQSEVRKQRAWTKRQKKSSGH